MKKGASCVQVRIEYRRTISNTFEPSLGADAEGGRDDVEDVFSRAPTRDDDVDCLWPESFVAKTFPADGCFGRAGADTVAASDRVAHLSACSII